jgi:ATP-dependent protease Clp ATPase subunit
MSTPAAINSQIADAVTQAHSAGGDEVLTILSQLMEEVARNLDRAKQGETTIDELSDAFESAEVALHGIVAKLATGRE